MTLISLFLPLIAALIVASIAVGAWSGKALSLVDADASLPAMHRYTAAAFGAGLLSIGAILLPGAHSLPLLLAYATFGALMGVLSVMDRETAWAPDGLILPLVIIGLIIGDSLNYFGLGMTLSILAAVAIFFTAQGLWLLQDSMNMRAVPPPDILALILPVFMLGVSISLVAFYILTAMFILICKRSPALLAVFSKPSALAEAEEDLGYQAPAITFLALAFPVLGVLIAVQPLFRLM